MTSALFIAGLLAFVAGVALTFGPGWALIVGGFILTTGALVAHQGLNPPPARSPERDE